ncbi:hypothetical protein AF49_05302, partial [Klebsiella pneumoniae MGH 63]
AKGDDKFITTDYLQQCHSKFKYLMVINDDNQKRVLVTVFERNE